MDKIELKIPFRTKPEIWCVAEDVRTKGWLSSLPKNQAFVPVDIETIAEKYFNLLPVPIPNLTRFVNTEAFLTGNLAEYDYDPEAIKVRLRFSVAHEIGHLILHPIEIKKLRSQSFSDWITMIQEMSLVGWGRAEYQAREFAGRLLVPKDELINQLKFHKNKIIQTQKQIKDIEAERLIPYISTLICKHFDVSVQVIVARIRSENINLLQL